MANGRTFFMAHGRYGAFMSPRSPSRSLDKVIVRLPDGMRAKLMAAGKAAGRTMNAEIVQRLEASFALESRPKNALSYVGEGSPTFDEIVLKAITDLQQIDANELARWLKSSHVEEED